MEFKSPYTSSMNDYKYFKEVVQEFGVVKEISCVFQVENLVFFENDINDYSYNFVAKSNDGNIMYLSNVNCGYGGEGPNTFRRILEYFGIDEELGHKIMWHRAVKLYFDENGKFKNYIVPEYFIDLNDTKNFIASTHIHFKALDKMFYIINPERFLNVLWSLLDNAKLYRIDYHLGENNELEQEYIKENPFIFERNIDLFDFEYGKDQKYRKQHIQAKQVNFICRGENYSVSLLVPNKIQLSFLESLFLYFKNDSYIMDHLETIRRYLIKPNIFEKVIYKEKIKTYLKGTIDLGQYDDM